MQVKELGERFTFVVWRLLQLSKQKKIRLELWHKRMGHPYIKAVGMLPFVSSSVSVASLNKSCDVCLRTKQTQESFPLNMNKTSTIFEMIHVDL